MRACKRKRTEEVPCPRPRLHELTLPTSYARRNTPYFSGAAAADGAVAVAASARTRTTRAGLAALLATTR
jgi:hypothetical protein